MITERYENTNGGHYKFWEVTYPGAGDSERFWSCRWGRIGTNGQMKMFQEPSAWNARNEAHRKIGEKQAKGYIWVGPAGRQNYQSEPSQSGVAQETFAPKPLRANDQLSDQTKTAVLAMLAANVSIADIVASLKVTRGQIAAIKAHQTMGTYSAPTLAAVSGGRSVKSAPQKKIGRRAMNLDAE